MKTFLSILSISVSMVGSLVAADLVSDGGVLMYGTTSTSVNIPSSGAGTRMLWYPAKSAFRAGIVNSTQWNDSNIGQSSTAFGINNQVSGVGGFSSGADNVVGSGYYSSALGEDNHLDNVSGTLVAGLHNYVTGVYGGFVAGNTNTVSNSIAVAIGEGNVSSGWGAMTVGRGLTSATSGTVVVGMHNLPILGGNGNYWAASDPVFIVGNGHNNYFTGSSAGIGAQSNALVVYKDGSVKIPKRQGDIGMGRFGNTGDE